MCQRRSKATRSPSLQGDRRYRVRGLGEEHELRTAEGERAGVEHESRGESGFHVDTLDLYSARQRTVFVKQAAEELGVKEDVIRRDLGPGAAEAGRAAGPADHAKRSSQGTGRDPAQRGGASRGAGAAARSRICSTASSRTSSAAGWWARRPTSWWAISRRCRGKLDAPLAVLVQSSSAAGKIGAHGSGAGVRAGRGAGAVLGDDRADRCSTWARRDLKHKVLAIVEEEGASRAAYALKLLQSEGVLTIASTGKDPATGRWSRTSTAWKAR